MKAFSIVADLATAVQAVALITLHLLPTGYNPVCDAVSDYGVGLYRGRFWLQTVAGGVGCLALAIALAELHPFTPTQVVVALTATAAARFLLLFFAADQQGSRFQTRHGTIHATAVSHGVEILGPRPARRNRRHPSRRDRPGTVGMKRGSSLSTSRAAQ
jgi:Protein of unknown function (DUF998)